MRLSQDEIQSKASSFNLSKTSCLFFDSSSRVDQVKNLPVLKLVVIKTGPQIVGSNFLKYVTAQFLADSFKVSVLRYTVSHNKLFHLSDVINCKFEG